MISTAFALAYEIGARYGGGRRLSSLGRDGGTAGLREHLKEIAEGR